MLLGCLSSGHKVDCRIHNNPAEINDVIVQTPFANQVQGIVQQAMIDGMQTFVSSVPITAEAVVGKVGWRSNCKIIQTQTSRLPPKFAG